MTMCQKPSGESANDPAGVPSGHSGAGPGRAVRQARDVTPDALAAEAGALLESGHRLALVAAHEDPGAMRVVYLFTAGGPDRRTELHVRLDPNEPVLPSLAALSAVNAVACRSISILTASGTSGRYSPLETGWKLTGRTGSCSENLT